MTSSTSRRLSRTFESKTFRLTRDESPALSVSVDGDEDLAIRELLKKQLENSSLLRLKTYEYPAYGNVRIIHKTFTLSRQGGNGRFSDKKQGAWYCSGDHNTAIDEVAYQHMRKMDFRKGKKPGTYNGVYTDEPVYRELFADITGNFYHTELPRDKDVLGKNPDTAYSKGQKLAHEIVKKGGQGIVYPSVRRSGGVCLAVFDPEAIQNVRLGARWKIIWNRSRKYKTKRLES